MNYEISPEIESFRKAFETRHPESKLDSMDWLRCSYAQRFLVGDSMLEIGPGVGMMLATAHKGMKVTAVDIRTHTQAMFPPGTRIVTASLAKPIEVEPHDTVLCMEVLEHLDMQRNEVALDNLRQLASRRIILTVPFEEKPPLWHHDRAGGHRQRFTIDKLAELFPNSYATLLPRYSFQWALVIEDRDISAPHFQFVTRWTLTELMGC